MGYKRKIRTFLLTFEDSEFEGLEIEVKSIPLGDFIDVSARFAKGDQTETDINFILEAFVKSVTRWNLEDENDKPVPTTMDGLRTLDFQFSLACVAAWLGGIAGPTGDLGKASASGDSSLEASIPMGDL